MGETVAQIWPQVVGIADFRNFTKMRDSSKAPLWYILIYGTPRSVHIFYLKYNIIEQISFMKRPQIK
jgi:hypothetical protein